MIPMRHTKDRAKIPQSRDTLRATLISETFLMDMYLTTMWGMP